MRTVLVVDDEAKIVQLARDYLEHAGFAVLTAADGPSAVETARRQHPDLVVLDLGLPGLDGLEVTRELRRDSSIPIVMLTARDDELDKLLGLELGADDYLTKPFSPARARRARQGGPATDRAGRRAGRRHPGRRRGPRRAPDACRGRRPDGRPHRDRVRAAGHARGQPGPDLHPVPAPRRAPWRRLRVVRAGDRLAHQEPAPQGRAGSARAALRADGVRRRATASPTTAELARDGSAADPTAGGPNDPGPPPPRPSRPWPAPAVGATRASTGATRSHARCGRGRATCADTSTARARAGDGARASAASSGSCSCSSSPRSSRAWRRSSRTSVRSRSSSRRPQPSRSLRPSPAD